MSYILTVCLDPGVSGMSDLPDVICPVFAGYTVYVQCLYG
jgi:hypothetical protein